jgi:hypothetical protein
LQRLLLARLFICAYIKVLLSFIIAMISSSFIHRFIVVLDFYIICVIDYINVPSSFIYRIKFQWDFDVDL